MDFYAVLDQVLDLLRQRGRVTYNALKRQFGLDDACLQDLKDEIIAAQRVAVDEDGKVLVWTGDVAAPPPPAIEPAPGRARSPDAGPQTYIPAHLAEKILTARPALTGERKQVPVLFADLAVASFEPALQALDHLPESSDTRVLAIELRLALGYALSALGEYGRCLALLGEAEALARGLDDRARLGQVLAGMAIVLRITGDHDGALAAGLQALDLAVELGDSALQVRASSTLGEAYYTIGDFSRAVDLQRRNVAAADRDSGTPCTDLRILSRAWLALTLSALGAFAEGRRHGEEALRLATLAGRGTPPSIAHGCLGILYRAQGDLEPAIRVLEQGLALCRASGNRNFLRTIMAGLSYAYTLQGRLAAGRALLEEGISENIRTGARQRSLWVAWLSEVCRLAGHGDEAWQYARQALDLARQHKERGNEALALHQLGTVQAHADPPDVAPAEAHYQQALTLASELGMRPLQAHCHLGLGRLYGQTGRGAPGRAALATAIELYRAHGPHAALG